MSKPFVIRYSGGEERFHMKDLEAHGIKARFRDVDLVVYKGSWGQETLKCHDTIVIPPDCDHEAENVSELPVWLLITNFTVE